MVCLVQCPEGSSRAKKTNVFFMVSSRAKKTNLCENSMLILVILINSISMLLDTPSVLFQLLRSYLIPMLGFISLVCLKFMFRDYASKICSDILQKK